MSKNYSIEAARTKLEKLKSKFPKVKRPFPRKTANMSDIELKMVAEELQCIYKNASLIAQRASKCKRLFKEKDAYLKRISSLQPDDPKSEKFKSALEKCDENIKKLYYECLDKSNLCLDSLELIKDTAKISAN